MQKGVYLGDAGGKQLGRIAEAQRERGGNARRQGGFDLLPDSRRGGHTVFAFCSPITLCAGKGFVNGAKTPAKPQGLKPQFDAAVNGTTEVVPFPKSTR